MLFQLVGLLMVVAIAAISWSNRKTEMGELTATTTTTTEGTKMIGDKELPKVSQLCVCKTRLHDVTRYFTVFAGR